LLVTTTRLRMRTCRIDVIRRNLIPADAFPYRTATGALYDSGDYQRALDEAGRRLVGDHHPVADAHVPDRVGAGHVAVHPVLAATLGLDPLDVIRRNLIPADAFPYRTATGALYDSVSTVVM
jgi:CO/xanthine dehydrogenase Mo-binding subunit